MPYIKRHTLQMNLYLLLPQLIIADLVYQSLLFPETTADLLLFI